jgi:2-polyprenyl-3-methyl-5-hydroxy-6-metoxy-1,4-benzoquinol methylase
MRTDPRPIPQAMGFYYPNDYGPYRGTVVNSREQDLEKASFLRKLIKRIFRFNTTRLPPLKPGRLLEIGCASGAFLNKMSKTGWRVQGLEFSEHAAKSARSLGFEVSIGSLEAAPDPEYLFDLVVGWMVLEHLHDPVLALQKLHRWVKPRGWLVASVPNAGAFEFKLFKSCWYALHVPNHLYHFTPDSLARICEAGGWRMEKIFHHRVITNFIASTGYRLQDRGILTRISEKLVLLPESRTGLINYMLYPLAFPLSILGQTGRMTIWARRVDD